MSTSHGLHIFTLFVCLVSTAMYIAAVFTAGWLKIVIFQNGTIYGEYNAFATFRDIPDEIDGAIAPAYQGISIVTIFVGIIACLTFVVINWFPKLHIKKSMKLFNTAMFFITALGDLAYAGVIGHFLMSNYDEWTAYYMKHKIKGTQHLDNFVADAYLGYCLYLCVASSVGYIICALLVLKCYFFTYEEYRHQPIRMKSRRTY